MSENIERTAPHHDATAHPSWAPGSGVKRMIEKHHFGTDQRIRVPNTGDPADAPIGETFVDGVQIEAAPVQQIANETYEAYIVYANPYQSNLGGPILALPFDDERKRALIINGDPAIKLLVGKLAQVQTGNGYVLPPGAQMEIKSRQPVYVAAATGSTSIQTSVWTERGR